MLAIKKKKRNVSMCP